MAIYIAVSVRQTESNINQRKAYTCKTTDFNTTAWQFKLFLAKPNRQNENSQEKLRQVEVTAENFQQIRSDQLSLKELITKFKTLSHYFLSEDESYFHLSTTHH